MKFFACLFAVAAIACIASADKTETKEGLVASTYGSPSYGGGASYSAPPCPKNYLLSCQPNLAPVPCSPGYGGSGGYAGAYSEHVPQYVIPQYGVPQY